MIYDTLPCDNCASDVLINNGVCDYCMTVVGSKEPSKTIITEISVIDSLEKDFKYSEALKKIKESKYFNFHIYKQRVAKITMKESIIGDTYINESKFIDSINFYKSLSGNGYDFQNEAHTYVKFILPNHLVRITKKSYINIINFLKKENKIFKDLIKYFDEQMICEQMGGEDFKEYLYYTDPKNHMDNMSFIKKKNFYLDLYKKISKAKV